jgi:intracellular multiplication protein IcmD
MKFNIKKISKLCCLLPFVGTLFYSVFAFADGPMPGGHTGIGQLAYNITQSFTDIGQLIIASAYIGGFILVIAAVFKFKQHKDNPTQIPMGTPVALLAIGAVLIFLPSIIGPAGKTIFGESGQIIYGQPTGEGFQKIGTNT